MPLDFELCSKQNVHNRTENDIRKAINDWIATPSSFTSLSYDCLFTDEMDDISDEPADLEAVSISDSEDEKNAQNADENISDDDEAFNEVRSFTRNYILLKNKFLL